MGHGRKRILFHEARAFLFRGSLASLSLGQPHVVTQKQQHQNQTNPPDCYWGTYRCMNNLLFDRSTGSLAPQAFARIQSTQLLHAIQPAPRLLFDGGEREVVASPSSALPTENLDPPATGPEEKSWAHQAGVNALSIDIEGRMYVLVPCCATYTNSNSLVSGGADSSIKLWGLDQTSQGVAHTLRPTGTVAR